MKLLNYRIDNQLHFGVLTSRGVLNVNKAGEREPGKFPSTLEQLIGRSEEAFEGFHKSVNELVQIGSDDLFQNEEMLDIAPCVANPGKIICVGLNYRRHAIESKMAIPTKPILFNKFNNTLSGHGDTVMIPKHSKQNDYEAELGIIIGKAAKYVGKEEALGHVFGYCTVNDLSSRDWQFRTNQWLLGKCLDGFNPIGPYLVTADEISDPNTLKIRCFVNGELRQNSNTSDMIFPCDEIISYISQHMTLEPGDVILTGTPEGVILGRPNDKQVWLEDGDVVIVEVEGLGRLTTVMKREV